MGTTYVTRDGMRVKVSDQREEPYLTCEAHAQGVAPKVYGAFETSDGKTVLVMENLDIGTLERYLQSPRNQEQDDKVDRALVRLFRTYSRPVGESYVCHMDLHSGNIALRQGANGTIEAKAIDWGVSEIVDRASTCNTEAFAGLFDDMYYIRRRMPLFAALIDSDGHIRRDGNGEG